MASKQSAQSTRPGGGVRGFGKRKRTTSHTEVEPTFGSRLRTFLPAAALPNGIVVMIAIVFALVALIATSSPMAALPSTIAQFWLVVNMVPVHGDGHTIGYLPMLPAALLAIVVAKRVHSLVKEKVSLADLGVLLLCVLLLPILLTLTAAAMLYDASVVYPVGVPNIALAIGMTALLHGSAFIIGMGRRLWRAIFKRFGIPQWFVESSLLASRGIAVIGAVSLAGVIISMAIHYQAVSESLAGYESTLGVIGAVVVSILYLPNAIVAAAAMLAGSEMQFGEGLFSLFGVNMVPLPPVPLLGAFPASAHPWAAALLVVMAVSIVYAVYRNVPRFGTGILAALFAGLFMLILCVFASGTLGVYGYVGPNLWMTAGFVFAWFAVVISLAVALVALISRRVAGEVANDEEYHDEAEVLTDDAEALGDESSEMNDAAAASDSAEESATEPAPEDQVVDAELEDAVETEDEEIAGEVEGGVSTDESPVDGHHDEHLETDSTAPVEEISEGESSEMDEDLSDEPLEKPITAAEPEAAEFDEPENEDDLHEAPQAEESWHADVFDDGEVEEHSVVADEVQQEALDEYESAGTEEPKTAQSTEPAKKPKKKRRRGGIFRRK